jgi:hypothetical protein
LPRSPGVFSLRRRDISRLPPIPLGKPIGAGGLRDGCSEKRAQGKKKKAPPGSQAGPSVLRALYRSRETWRVTLWMRTLLSGVFIS